MMKQLVKEVTFPNARSILPLGDPRLQQMCEVVSDFGAASDLIASLRDTMNWAKSRYHFARGCGIAAPQLGELKRICLVEYEGEQSVLINPRISAYSREKIMIQEGCMSFFEYRATVERFQWVTVTAQNQSGQEYQIAGEGDFASLLQHEIDHLDGILTIDRLSNGSDGLVRDINSIRLSS